MLQGILSTIAKIQKVVFGRAQVALSEQTLVATTIPRRIVVFSPDDSLPNLVKATAPESWQIIWFSDVLEAQTNLAQPNVRIVIVDDTNVEESDRGWIVTRVRRDLPCASIIYIASCHSQATERTARASGAHYYTAGPLDYANFEQVLRGFLRVSE